MPDDALLWLGGGTLAAAALWPRRAESAASPPLAALPPLDLGRPTPTDVPSIVSSGWSRPRGDRLHRALDIPLPVGTPVLAVDDGLVVRVRATLGSDAGRWVGVRHASGLVSRYLHLSRPLVALGQVVRRGQVIGHSGNTGNSAGPHLHLDLRATRELLARVEASVGRPRGGWGPELPPYGVSIPGEPWIPVDGYRESVRHDATRAGVPLRAGAPRNGSLTYRPVGDAGRYPDWVRELRGKSGVYVIRDRTSHAILYVGQSSTARLYQTLTRHFSDWRRWKSFWRGQYAEGHDPGLTYARAAVEVAVRVLPADRALDEEARLITRLAPRDNILGQPAPDDVPF